jgi:hypothetical protein
MYITKFASGSCAIALSFTLLVGLAIAKPKTKPVPLDRESVDSVKTAISKIYAAAKEYHADTGKWPDTIEQLLHGMTSVKQNLSDSNATEPETYPYLELNRSVLRQWSFEFWYDSPPQTIRAVSKTRTFRSEPHQREPVQIQYDVWKGTWEGYGVPVEVKDTLTSAQKADLASEAKNLMPIIWSGAQEYYRDRGTWPQTVEELDREHYLDLEPSTVSKWNFGFIQGDPSTVIAISTQDMPGGAGHALIYDVSRNQWKGWGIR